jgi:hypothetical protein
MFGHSLRCHIWVASHNVNKCGRGLNDEGTFRAAAPYKAACREDLLDLTDCRPANPACLGQTRFREAIGPLAAIYRP